MIFWCREREYFQKKRNRKKRKRGLFPPCSFSQYSEPSNEAFQQCLYTKTLKNEKAENKISNTYSSGMLEMEKFKTLAIFHKEIFCYRTDTDRRFNVCHLCKTISSAEFSVHSTKSAWQTLPWPTAMKNGEILHSSIHLEIHKLRIWPFCPSPVA